MLLVEVTSKLSNLPMQHSRIHPISAWQMHVSGQARLGALAPKLRTEQMNCCGEQLAVVSCTEGHGITTLGTHGTVYDPYPLELMLLCEAEVFVSKLPSTPCKNTS